MKMFDPKPQNKFFSDGLKNYYENDYATAIEYFELAIKKDANYAPAYWFLNLSYAQSGKSTEGSTYEKKARELDANIMVTCDKISRNYLANNNNSIIKNENSKQDDSVEQLAKLFEQQNFAPNENNIKNNLSASDYCSLGMRQLKNKDCLNAINSFNSAIKLGDGKVTPNAYLGISETLSASGGDFIEIVSNYAIAITLDPRIGKISAQKTNNYIDECLKKGKQSGDYDEAKFYCELALKLDPNSNIIKNILSSLEQLKADCYRDGIQSYFKGNYQNAIKYFSEAIKNDPKNIIDAYKHRALAKCELNDNQGAVKDIQEILKLSLNDAAKLYYEGLGKYFLKDYQGAIGKFNQAASITSIDKYSGFYEKQVEKQIGNRFTGKKIPIFTAKKLYVMYDCVDTTKDAITELAKQHVTELVKKDNTGLAKQHVTKLGEKYVCFWVKNNEGILVPEKGSEKLAQLLLDTPKLQKICWQILVSDNKFKVLEDGTANENEIAIKYYPLKFYKHQFSYDPTFMSFMSEVLTTRAKVFEKFGEGTGNKNNETVFNQSDMANNSIALTYYNMAIDLDPKNFIALQRRGTIKIANFGEADLIYLYKDRGNIREDGLNDLTAAINLNPNYVLAYINRPFGYTKMQIKGWRDLAIADCSRAIELNPSCALAYSNRGWLKYNEKNDLVGGREDIEIAKGLAEQQKDNKMVDKMTERLSQINRRQTSIVTTSLFGGVSTSSATEIVKVQEGLSGMFKKLF